MGATANFYFNTRRQKQDGTFPLKLRITYKRQQRYYSTDVNLSAEQWKKVSSLKPKEDFIRDIKALLEAISRRVERVVKATPAFIYAHWVYRYLTLSSNLKNQSG